MTCLVNGSAWLFFALNDLAYMFMGILPDAIPSEAIIGNSVLFTGIAALNFAGWKDSGKVTPNFDNLVPYGTLGRALLVNMCSLAMVRVERARLQYLDSRRYQFRYDF